MKWWKKILKVAVPLGSVAASIFIKNPDSKKIAEKVQDIVNKIEVEK